MDPDLTTTTTTTASNELRHSNELDKLAAALAKAQSAITFASKDSTNPHFKNRYADLAAVWEGCRAPLTANGLAVSQFPSANGRAVTVTTILLHESGQFLAMDLTMTAQQDTPQAIGSCITYARRYALSAVAGIAQDDDDGEAATATRGNDHASSNGPAAAGSGQRPRPYGSR